MRVCVSKHKGQEMSAFQLRNTGPWRRWRKWEPMEEGERLSIPKLSSLQFLQHLWCDWKGYYWSSKIEPTQTGHSLDVSLWLHTTLEVWIIVSQFLVHRLPSLCCLLTRWRGKTAFPFTRALIAFMRSPPLSGVTQSWTQLKRLSRSNSHPYHLIIY